MQPASTSMPSPRSRHWCSARSSSRPTSGDGTLLHTAGPAGSILRSGSWQAGCPASTFRNTPSAAPLPASAEHLQHPGGAQPRAAGVNRRGFAERENAPRRGGGDRRLWRPAAGPRPAAIVSAAGLYRSDRESASGGERAGLVGLARASRPRGRGARRCSSSRRTPRRRGSSPRGWSP